MKPFALVLLVVLSLIYSAHGITFSNCTTNPAVGIRSIDISPGVIYAGNDIDVTLDAVAINGGKFEVVVSMFNVVIIRREQQICSVVPCPVADGNFHVTQRFNVPNDAFPGYYTAKNRLLDASGNVLTCVTFKFQVKMEFFN